ncbi:SAM-dependent methyltransferase, partial [Nonomuraea sp. M3C6]
GAAATRLLTGVFPSISAASADETVDWPEVTALTRYRTYRAIRSLVERLSATSGIAILLDDIHWADEASIELLDHLLRHPPLGNVLIAIAYRQWQTEPRIASLIESVLRHGQLVRADPFTLTETEEFLGPQVEAQHRRAIHEASNGIPLYLEALAYMRSPRALIGVGEDTESEGELPISVQAALYSELHRLSPVAFQVVQAASLITDEFDPDNIAAATQLGKDDVLAAFDEITTYGLIHPTRIGGRFRFRHPLVRNAAHNLASNLSDSGLRPASQTRIAAHVNANVAHPARIYDYLLGGKENFEADRTSAAEIIKSSPLAPIVARENRKFLVRAVEYLAPNVEQFIDIGAGFPTRPNAHQVARRQNPGARVAYVDNDPMVLSHARAMLPTDDRTIAVGADMTTPYDIVHDSDIQNLIDFTKPVAVLLVAVLHFLEDEAAGKLVGAFREVMVPGSCLVISHMLTRSDLMEARLIYRRATRTHISGRTRDEIDGMFDGFAYVEPGLVPVAAWRPTRDLPTRLRNLPMLAGIGILRQ